MAKFTVTITDDETEEDHAFFDWDFSLNEDEQITSALLYTLAIQRIVDSGEINNVVNAIVAEKVKELGITV